ncbi:hypothetical protein HPO96_20330 [Kribbella sandramycini]|uniref:Secreted protein n=1 Tax=Kribbella sandramycini TaxID=60450 RepID=A0A7Y4L373_9ACTN|nr:hypothetical protein [Kribbella sandramycini]MBB6564900.1 hypothetical protein [Kribbella sandramycini]NOL42596.1 hypothetical protein [Kribbella sandramycini]
MRIRRTLATAAATLLLLAGSFGTAYAADQDADDLDTGTPTSPTIATTAPVTPKLQAEQPNFQTCRLFGTYWGETCFQWVGDLQWVRDLQENGWATVFHVQTNYDKNRYCQALPKAQGWAYCNFDHKEGKCVRFRSYELKAGEMRNHTVWSPWYGTEYGSPC